MFLLLSALCVACAVGWLSLKWYQLRMYWSKRGVPHLAIYPLIGSMTYLMRYSPVVWFKKIKEDFKEPYVGFWIFFRPALIVQSPELARRILVKDSGIFRDRLTSSGANDPIGAQNLFTLNDPQWSSIRRRLTPVFTASKLRNLFGVVKEKTDELVKRIESEMERNKQLEIRMVLTDYTTDVIGRVAFGLSGDATLTGDSPLRSVTKEFMEFSVWRGFSMASIFYLPELVETFGFTMFPQSATDYFRNVFNTIVAQRGGYEVEITENRDMLDALRKLKQEFVRDNEDISVDTLIAQAVAFLQAGFDTTATVLSYCFYELAFHPDIQNKLYNEIVEGCQTEEEILDVARLTELKYLNCVLSEALRKYANLVWLERIASVDYEVDEKLTISAGTPVYVNTTGIHYDPEIYPEPDRFDPDRFSDSANVQPFALLPFGEGPRGCIGRRFAMVNLRIAVATVFLKFEARPLPNSPEPHKIQLESRSVTHTPEDPLLIQFMPRIKT